MRRRLNFGDEIPEVVVPVTRAQLRRYADLSGDHNPIHQDESVAHAVGLPGVVAHGMFTMGVVGRVLADYIGDVAAIIRYSTRFTRPVVVPADDAEPNTAEIHITGKVSEVNDGEGTATISMTATFNGQTVLGRTQATVLQP
ncbi:MAG: hypothetical protein RL745_458 [Actinomycetota bacterium]|jgi:hypothetical protein